MSCRIECLAIVASLALLTQPAGAQTVEQFYKGRSITLLVGVAPGGINDLSARLVARHLGRFIPGNPTFVVQNSPGAGGISAANRLFNDAAKDGSFIAKIERAVPQLAIQGDKNASFDPVKLTWLGSVSSYKDDAYLMLVNANHPAQNVADLKKPGVSVTLGGDTSASSNLIFALIARDVLEPQRQGGARLSWRGADVPRHAARRARRPDGGPELDPHRPEGPVGQESIPAADALRPDHAAAGFPRRADRARTDHRSEALALIEFAELPFLMSLPFAAPPDIPADRAIALQDAFIEMSKDAGLRRRGREARLRRQPDRRRHRAAHDRAIGRDAEGRDRPLQPARQEIRRRGSRRCE